VAQSAKKKRTGGTGKAATQRRRSQAAQPSASDYAREAASEWGRAARFGAAALLASGAKGAGGKAAKSADKPPLKERLNPATTEKGGKVGDAADNLLSKLGFVGKAASKLSLGSRAIDKVLPDSLSRLQPSGEGDGGGVADNPPVPIQESIDVAVPIGAAYALATRFEDHPQWSDRIKSAEEIDDTHVAFEVKVVGLPREIEIEITEEQPEWRLEWEATDGIEHGGMLTLHELAPSLTRVELSIDMEPEGVVERLGRSIHLPERAIRTELHRFKAWAELWQEVEDIEPPEEPEEGAGELEDEFDEEPEDEFDEEPEDEEELEEEPEDEGEDFEEEDEDDFEDEPEDEVEDVPEDELEDEEDFEEEELEAEGGRYRTR
jgi:Polyketide cyclase / dehydrase and lipid transport